MITRYLSRPDNVLINRLGYGTNWKIPTAFSNVTRRFFFLFRIFFLRFIDFLWRSGLLHTNHPFVGRLFFNWSYTVLPNLNSADDVSRYFRLTRVRLSSRLRGKRFFVTRRYLHFLSIGEFFFYRLNNLILVLLFIHIPEPIKRRFFIADYLGLNNALIRRNRLPGYFAINLTRTIALLFFSKVFLLF